ncbi:MAG TPA: hypothetical protein VH573_02680 [Mycobacteriales bacterium]
MSADTGALRWLDDETCELLPRREAPALVNITTITAVNLALAINAASPGATAVAWAGQWIGAFQH